MRFATYESVGASTATSAAKRASNELLRVEAHASSRRDRPAQYEIVVGGELSDPFGAAVPEMTLHAEAGQTRISGVIVDQSHLHGVLESLLGSGIELRSLNEVSGKQFPAAPDKG